MAGMALNIPAVNETPNSRRRDDVGRQLQDLHKDTPVPREVLAVGRVFSVPILGGLHHQ